MHKISLVVFYGVLALINTLVALAILVSYTCGRYDAIWGIAFPSIGVVGSVLQMTRALWVEE